MHSFALEGVSISYDKDVKDNYYNDIPSDECGIMVFDEPAEYCNLCDIVGIILILLEVINSKC